LPALLRAQRVAAKAAKLRPAPASLQAVLEQKAAAHAALEAQVKRPAPTTDLEDALGAALFLLCELARGLGLSAEDALRAYTSRLVKDATSESGATGATP
jgi:uncharacterized protein YabN with tetrapyrrole methylase and pyrophosphatase domain